MDASTGANINVAVGKKYRFTFEYLSGMAPGSISTPKSIAVSGYGIEITRWENVYTERTLIVELRVLHGATEPGTIIPGGGGAIVSGANRGQIAPIAVGASVLILAALAVLGVGMLYLTLTKIEEIVDSPVGGTLSLALVAVAAFVAWKLFKGK